MTVLLLRIWCRVASSGCASAYVHYSRFSNSICLRIHATSDRICTPLPAFTLPLRSVQIDPAMEPQTATSLALRQAR